MGWNDITTKEGSDREKIRFAELKEGKLYQMRALDEAPYSRYTHWIPQANGGKGLTIDCIGKDCPICADRAARKAAKETQKYGARKQHAMNVINRETGEVEILDKGKRCYEALAGIRDMVGDLRNFDIKIQTKGSDTDTNYVPIPMPEKPLTDVEKALTKYDFNVIYPKLTKEQVLELMAGKGFQDIFGNSLNNTDDDQPELEDVDFTN